MLPDALRVQALGGDVVRRNELSSAQAPQSQVIDIRGVTTLPRAGPC